MSSKIDINVLELMASKLCHDLISPIGAVNNGVELLEDLGADGSDDVVNLISYSAEQASVKLQAYRMAYGAGGVDQSIKAEDVYNAFEAYIKADKKVTQNWDPYSDLGFSENPTGFCKVLINVLLLAHDTLPKGGEITLSSQEAGKLIISAQGEDAGLKDGYEEALAQKTIPNDLAPKIIHPYLTGLIAENYGFNIQIDKQESNSVTLLLSSQ